LFYYALFFLSLRLKTVGHCVAGLLGNAMTASTSIRIEQKLYEQARSQALAEHRTIAGQVEYWAKVGRAALDNPDLPVSFIAESLASMAKSREEATAFEPTSTKEWPINSGERGVRLVYLKAVGLHENFYCDDVKQSR
jgi:hypothetical protein